MSMSQRNHKTVSVVVVGWIVVIVGLLGAGAYIAKYCYWNTVPENYHLTRDPHDFIAKQVWFDARLQPEAGLWTPYPVPRLRALYLRLIPLPILVLLFGICLVSRKEVGRKLSLVLLLLHMLWSGTALLRQTPISLELVLHLIRIFVVPLFLMYWLVSPGGKEQFQKS